MKPHDRTTGHHLPYGITQCYLPADTGKQMNLHSDSARLSINLSDVSGLLSNGYKQYLSFTI